MNRTITRIGMTMWMLAGAAGCELNGGGWGDGHGGYGWGEPTGDEAPTDPGASDDGGLDVPPEDQAEARYYAIYLEDRWNGRCATSGVGAHGADIDAIGLWDPSGDPANPTLIAWLDIADGDFDATACDRYGYSSPDGAIGPPDGSLTDGFYSLAGGWLIGEFESQLEILPEYLISVHEVDDTYCMGIGNCVGSEGYDIYLATDLDCPNTGDDYRARCMKKLTGDAGAMGSASISGE